MPKIQVEAFQCSKTKKVFIDKKKYIKHLAEQRANLHNKLRRAQLKVKLKEFNRVDSWEKLIAWVEDNSDVLWTNGSVWDNKKTMPKDFRVKITYLDLTHTDLASNTHCHPRDGVGNWSREAGKPTGYPGWVGRIEFQVLNSKESMGSDLFRNTGIHTGTGGGVGSGRYGYGVTFFDSDWPRLCKDIVLDILKGVDNRHSFQYGKPHYFKF